MTRTESALKSHLRRYTRCRIQECLYHQSRDHRKFQYARQGIDLVEQLVKEIRGVTSQDNYSFAAKYAHFFIDPTLPILDSYAEWMLARHLGRELQSKDPRRYHRFTEDIETLKRFAGLTCNCADLDAYLWVAGEYWYWKDHREYSINGDLRALFEKLQGNSTAQPLLAALLDIAATAEG